MNADDLLSFKEFPPIHDSYERSGSAEININSPNRNYGGQMMSGAGGGAGPGAGDGDKDFNDLVNQMSTSAQMMNTTENIQTQDGSNEKSHSFLSIEYYQKFFNVDTTIVMERIASSMIPRRAPVTYLKHHIGANPDLYGPFWIAVTLIFSIAISGNVANYLQHSANQQWRYNFHLVSIAATTIMIYVSLVPLGLWFALRWFVRPVADDQNLESANDDTYIPGILTLMCIYGYSLVIYIPVSILWVIQVSFLQWIFVLSATFLSGSVLVIVLSPAIRNTRISLILAAAIVGAHFLLAAGFMLYFFHVPDVVVDKVEKVVQTVVLNQTKN